MTSDLSSALEVLDDSALYKSTYTLLYFTDSSETAVSHPRSVNAVITIADIIVLNV